MIGMAEQSEIPCASCHSWVKKQRKFSCKPDECPGLSKWIFSNAPNLGGDDGVRLLAGLPECAMQYVV
jgi:hypothetical protein